METRDVTGGGGGAPEVFSVHPMALHEMASWLGIYGNTFAAQAGYARDYLYCEAAFPFYSEDLYESYRQAADREVEILDGMTRTMAGSAARLRRTAETYEAMERRGKERASEVDRMLAMSTPDVPYVWGDR